MTNSYRSRLLASTLFVSSTLLATPAWAQEANTTQPPAEEPVLGEDAAVGDESADGNSNENTIVVTGSRIARPNLESNTPIQVVEGEALQASGDVTLETFLQTLPQANPAATTTSNNPGNQGRAELDLRGLGSNRNLVLVDGRRPMVSSSTMIVDLNTIPAALIERVDVISGGAGATYGADAVSGVVNLILKDDFEGIDGRVTYANTAETDAGEFNASLVLGANFNEGRGNAVMAFDFTDRESLIKKQRAFAAFATSTTTFLPEGYINGGQNVFAQAAVDALFGQASYGSNAPGSVAANTGLGFNLDGSIFSVGTFNTPINALNFRYPIDFSVNQALYPDLYSYNFDEVNLLVLPLRRKSIMAKMEYEVSDLFQPFAQFGWTRYKSRTALAPTPAPTVSARRLGDPNATPQDFITSLVTDPAGTAAPVTGFLIIPTTNPFISNDLRALLNSRTGDDPNVTGAGATEPFLLATRTLGAGARFANFENTVTQYMGGMRGNFGGDWRYEAYYSEGRTNVVNLGEGAIDTQRLQNLVEAPTGTLAGCTYNPFGRQPLTPTCIQYLSVNTRSETQLKQRIAQAFVSGPVAELPAGALSVVLGAELRRFRYGIDPGSLSGPISGPNTVTAAAGKNSFRDVFGEIYIPLLRDATWAQELDVSLSGRISKFDVKNLTVGTGFGQTNKSTDATYGLQVNWQPIRPVRLRGTYQRAVRAPNFGELFAGGGSAPQYFDPCSVGTAFTSGNLGLSAAQALAFCADANSSATPIAGFNTWVQPPGSQISITLAGNPSVSPEKADTFTLGAVMNAPGTSGFLSTLRGSIDYYNISIKDAIVLPDPNMAIAACFNYIGTNPSFNPNDPTCLALLRTGNRLSRVLNPVTGGTNFVVNNSAAIKTSGIDAQLSWAFPLGGLGLDSGRLNFDAFVNYLINYKRRDAIPGQPFIDYAGTVGYFGAGLTGGGGASFPEWRGTLNTNLTLGDFGVNLRTRYIHSMDNRASVQYVGEDASFTGVDSQWYFDTAATWKIDNMLFRLGVNNLFDKQPQLYAPNVQSGTDPSTYDVIGRRFFVSVGLKY